MDVDAASRAMIAHMPEKTGRSLEQWFAVLDAQPYEKHGQAMAYLKAQHGVSHGFANMIVAQHRDRHAGVTTATDLVDAQYSGGKEALRSVYERLVAAARAFGTDVEVAPKKTAVSLRRRKQFAVVEAPSTTRVQLGLNLRGWEPTTRLRAATGMCTHRVDVRSADDVDAELLGWMHSAYELA